MSILKAYVCSQRWLAYQPKGADTTKATITSRAKSLYNSCNIPFTEAPSTLRMPISLVRCTMV